MPEALATQFKIFLESNFSIKKTKPDDMKVFTKEQKLLFRKGKCVIK